MTYVDNRVITPSTYSLITLHPGEWTPIHYAIIYGHKDIVKILAKRACNLDIIDPDGLTLIQRAAKQGNLEIVKILAPLVKDPNALDPDGLTPIQRIKSHLVYLGYCPKGFREIEDILELMILIGDDKIENTIEQRMWIEDNDEYEIIVDEVEDIVKFNAKNRDEYEILP